MSAAATAVLPAAAVRARPPTNKWLVTLSVTFGTLMGAIDASIVNVALTHIRGTVGATVEEITWISTGFAVATILVMPLTAFLGRLFGQKRVYMASLALFIVGSVLCGLAHSLPALVLFRALQGFGAGALQPTEQAILRQTFPPKEQGMAMSLFALAIMVGPAIGPTLGGYIVDNVAWQWIFYINVPVGILGLFMVHSFVHEQEDIRAANRELAEKQRKNVDWWGIGLMSVGLSSLQFVLEEGNRRDWFESGLVLVLAAVALLTLVGFILRELTAPVPAVDLSLFKDKVFLSGTLVSAIMYCMLMSLTFLLPVFMQELLGFTATQSGLSLMPRTLMMMVCIPMLGRLYNRLPPRALIAFGVLMLSTSAWMMSHYTLQTSSAGVVRALLVQGLGFSCLMVPINTLALSNVPRHRMADATGLNSLMRQVGGSLGLAVFANILSRQGVVARAALSAHITAGAPEAMRRLQGMVALFGSKGMDPVSAQHTALAALAGTVAREAMVLSFEHVFLLAGICFLAVLPLSFFLKRPKDAASAAPAEVHIEA